jgi:hypothetical protein
MGSILGGPRSTGSGVKQQEIPLSSRTRQGAGLLGLEGAVGAVVGAADRSGTADRVGVGTSRRGAEEASPCRSAIGWKLLAIPSWPTTIELLDLVICVVFVFCSLFVLVDEGNSCSCLNLLPRKRCLEERTCWAPTLDAAAPPWVEGPPATKVSAHSRP